MFISIMSTYCIDFPWNTYTSSNTEIAWQHFSFHLCNTLAYMETKSSNKERLKLSDLFNIRILISMDFIFLYAVLNQRSVLTWTFIESLRYVDKKNLPITWVLQVRSVLDTYISLSRFSMGEKRFLFCCSNTGATEYKEKLHHGC